MSSGGGKRNKSSSNNTNDALNADGLEADLRVFIRDIRDQLSRKRALNIKSWLTIKDVKDQLSSLFAIPAHCLVLYVAGGSGIELPNHRSLHDAGIYKSKSK
jgi:hypothetical protein